jgi:hypothetical protein
MPVYINYHNQTVKNYIYSNGDLDLWHNDPIINRVLPLPQGNHVVRTLFILGSKVKGTVTINRIFDNGRFHMITLVLYIGSLSNLTTWLPCGRFFPFHRGIMWPSLVKIRYTPASSIWVRTKPHLRGSYRKSYDRKTQKYVLRMRNRKFAIDNIYISEIIILI